MSRQYLNVPFAQKDAAKSLGARFDGAVKRWYVDEGRDLTAFSAWLPVATPVATSAPQTSRELAEPAAGSLAVSQPKGITLSRLLGGVALAVTQAFDKGVWTLVEVVEARARGHVYLEVSERDNQGQPVAKARAVIWASTASRILPEFEKATGAVIGAGIKLLVRAKPVFSAQYGLSLEIDAIDPDYTLGNLEARKKEIRDRLQNEGVFDHNRRLASPWDYRSIVVVAPEDGAGLGDFRKEAERLAHFGICRFTYVFSRFQGEGAARGIVSALADALAQFGMGERPDAIVLIRGGGAVNDLAWLNDYDLARFICDQDIPVLTGIGHERDHTLPDEVAHTRFDTPSKVIAGIEQHILRRAREAGAAAQDVFSAAARAAQRMRALAERADAQIRADAQAHLVRARHRSAQAMNSVEVASLRQVRNAAARSTNLSHRNLEEAARHLARARQEVPALMGTVRMRAVQTLGDARGRSDIAFNTTLARAGAATRSAGRSVDDRMQRLSERAHDAVQGARTRTESLMREVTGQGPEKTLTRGFAIVRAPDGRPVTASAQASELATLDIQFRDGTVKARPDPTT